MIVSAPGSSANLGSGFDCLALAIDLPFRLAVGTDADRTDADRTDADRTDADRTVVDRTDAAQHFHPAEVTHPAVVAFREAGGDPDAPLSWASPIPPGRGLGYSGAARVAGAYAAGLLDGLDHTTARDGAHRVASVLEGHADNSAASAFGRFTVAVGERVLSLDAPADVSVIVWSPSTATSTDASRRALPGRVLLEDAAFSVARAAVWVAALATDDLTALREACEDRLHQDVRLDARPDAREVRDHLLGREEVLAAWLSGSGPSIAALVPADLAPLVAGSIGGDGTVRVLDVDVSGVRIDS